MILLRHNNGMAITLRNKTALITGAAQRIGRSLALALAAEGINLVLHYRTSRAQAESLARETSALGVHTWLVNADFERPGEAEALMEKSFSLAQNLDFLICSASLFLPSTLASVSWPQLERDIRVNAWSPLVLGRAFQKHASKGHILHLLDTRIQGADFQHVAYLWSKQMLASMLRMTAAAYAPGIQVNGIAPGLILPPAGQGEEYAERLAEKLPLRKRGTPDDLCQAVLFLLRSEFITGEIVRVDGGHHLKELRYGPNSD